MDPASLFQIANPIALVGWVVLLASPFIPKIADRVSGLAIPLLFGVAYTGLIMAFWSSGQGGFDSLANVALLFETPELLLAGWIHYLAFDLFVGAWIARTAREEGIRFWFVVPCLALTFLFGPAGYLLFNAIRAARLSTATTAAA
ncbi:MAG TPA: ABA4-like family protein [Rhizobiaceae bacterium]|nr:ABA4-like family protein [Rhizobiaceae bacterium]